MSNQSLSRPVAESIVAAHESVEHPLVLRRTILTPHATNWDPFILWGEDIFEQGAFEMHPHRGFETVTYVISGELSHLDSTGGSGTIGAGSVEWCTAGAGIMHEEEPVEGQVHALQLWLNLPAEHKAVAPRYQALAGNDMPTIGNPQFSGRVFAGTVNGVRGPAAQYTPATFADFAFTDGSLDVDVDAAQRVCIFVVAGALEVNGTTVPAGSAVHCEPGEGVLHLTCLEPGNAVLCAGEPIGEPVVWDGPFVMNTDEEIAQAYHDLEANVFAAR